ncbi:MAG: cell division protein FtsZ [Alphaproteobacteria bacterium]
MTLKFAAPQMTELKPRIVVIGVGGAGGNAVNNMIRSGLEGVEFLVANTDAQALGNSQADRKIQLGVSITQGLGCGARPEIGRQAAEEQIDQILDHLQGTHMAFITAGMGGGTGTGAAPVIAEVCRQHNILTVGVVTKPFHFEGSHRMKLAERGIEELSENVDTLIIIPNQNLFRVANEKTTFADAFSMADDVLHSGVRGITDLMVMPGLINLDFADVRTVMGEMGKAMMGTGEADGDKRAVDAAESAISNPLLDDVSMKGAKGVLINITGGMDLTLFEVDEAANRIREEVDPEANIIVGSALDEKLEGRMRVSVVATGIDVIEGQLRHPPKLYAVGAGAAAAAVMAEPEPMPEPVAEAEPQFDVDEPVEMPDAVAIAEPEMSPLPEPTPFAAEAEPEPAPIPRAKPLGPAPELAGVPQAQPMVEATLPVDEPFVAAPAIDPDEIPAGYAEPEPEPMPEPLAEAPAEPTAPKRSRGLSLFARMTGAVSSKAAETETARAPLPRRNPNRDAVAPDLAGPDPEDRLPRRRQEEDLLEIPSFLRRQAN